MHSSPLVFDDHGGLQRTIPVCGVVNSNPHYLAILEGLSSCSLWLDVFLRPSVFEDRVMLRFITLGGKVVHSFSLVFDGRDKLRSTEPVGVLSLAKAHLGVEL